MDSTSIDTVNTTYVQVFYITTKSLLMKLIDSIDIRLIELYWMLKEEGILMITYHSIIYLTYFKRCRYSTSWWQSLLVGKLMIMLCEAAIALTGLINGLGTWKYICSWGPAYDCSYGAMQRLFYY